MRCLALAQALKKEGLDSVFLVNSEAEKICQSRNDWQGAIVVLPAHIHIDEELSFIANKCNDENAQVIVLDGYEFDHRYRANLKTLTIPVVCFDDSGLNYQHPPQCLHADVIINGASHADDIDYQQENPTSRLCVGDKFRVLRDEFVNMKSSAIELRKRVTISMGGSDPLDFSKPILLALKNHKLDAKITLVTGAAYTYLDWLEEFKQQGILKFEHLHDCQNIANIFADSRWVISAAGGSQFELQSCGTPACLLVVADNQLAATTSAIKQGWCVSIDCRDAPDDLRKTQLAEQAVEHMLAALSDSTKLQEMSEKALLTADTLGAKRVVSCIKEVANID